MFIVLSIICMYVCMYIYTYIYIYIHIYIYIYKARTKTVISTCIDGWGVEKQRRTIVSIDLSVRFCPYRRPYVSLKKAGSRTQRVLSMVTGWTLIITTDNCLLADCLIVTVHRCARHKTSATAYLFFTVFLINTQARAHTHIHTQTDTQTHKNTYTDTHTHSLYMCRCVSTCYMSFRPDFVTLYNIYNNNNYYYV